MNSFIYIIVFVLVSVATVLHAGEPEVYEPGKVSTDAIEYGITFSSTGDEMFFVRAEGQWGKGALKGALYHSIKTDGVWSEPVVLPFSGQYDDSDPHLTQDGRQLYFVSDRPGPDGSPSADIWMVSRTLDGRWQAPSRLGSEINSSATEYSPRTTAMGDLYFASDRHEGFGQGDLYVARKGPKGFKPAENLGSRINSKKGEWNLEINLTADLLIFEASGRAGNRSSYGDLYISFKQDGIWSIPQNISELNSTGSDLTPKVMGDYLFFASSQKLDSPSTDIFIVSFSDLLQAYRKSAGF